MLYQIYVILDQTRLGIWILDGDTHHRNLLRYAIPKHNFSNTLVMLVVSMASPWSIAESLQRWVDVLATHVDRLKLEPDERREFEQNREYTLLLFSSFLPLSLFCSELHPLTFPPFSAFNTDKIILSFLFYVEFRLIIF